MKYAHKGRRNDRFVEAGAITPIGIRTYNAPTEDGSWVCTMWDKPHGDPELVEAHGLININMCNNHAFHPGQHVKIIHMERTYHEAYGVYPLTTELSPYFWEVVAIIPTLVRDQNPECLDAIVRRTDRLIERGLVQ